MSNRTPVPNCRTAVLHRVHSRKTNGRTSSASSASSAVRQGAPSVRPNCPLWWPAIEPLAHVVASLWLVGA
jgi:hypothetical protein